jgi:hypothetical protein
LSGIFTITTVKFKELKINIEVEEIHPTTGIKNAGIKKNGSNISTPTSRNRCTSRGYHIYSKE